MSFEFRADIHCHSNCSDGSDSPFDLLDQAKKKDLKGLSITDHDTIAAYTPEFFAQAHSLSIQILPGVEISTELDRVAIHILGYGFDLKNAQLIEFLQNIQISRTSRNRSILGKLALKKMVISEDELLSFTQSLGKEKSIGRPHIAHLMMQKGFVRSVQEAFELYLRDGAPCYVSGFKFTPLQAIEHIHQAQGKAVLAHPHFIKPHSIVHKLLNLPFDGLECYYGNLNKIQEMSWVQTAKKKQWLATGGSDYHGLYRPHISLGCSWVDLVTFQALQ
jgi:predicted metal-dependent phosphoesterase TrpH